MKSEGLTLAERKDRKKYLRARTKGFVRFMSSYSKLKTLYIVAFALGFVVTAFYTVVYGTYPPVSVGFILAGFIALFRVVQQVVFYTRIKPIYRKWADTLSDERKKQLFLHYFT